MKNITAAGIIAAGLTAGFLGFAAPALAAPSGAVTAGDTISSLQAEGYSVIVKNPDNVPLDQASVASITPINSTDLVWDPQHHHRHTETSPRAYIITVQ